MKLKLFSAVLALAATLSANPAFAKGNTSFGKIESLNAGSAIQIRGTMSGDPDACGDTDAYILEETDPNFKNLYAGLLTALASGANARLNVDGCVQNAAMTKNRPSVKSITVEP